MTIEDWIRLLSTYGPFALILFIAIILEPKGRSYLKDVRAGHIIARTTVYVITWLAIFVMCGISVWVWIRLNVPPEEVTIRGRMIGLDPRDDVRSPSQEVYFHRVSDKQCDFLLRIISQKKLTGREIRLYVDRSGRLQNGGEDFSIYSLPISADFYAMDEVVLPYDDRSKSLSIQRGGRITPLHRTEVRNPRPLYWSLAHHSYDLLTPVYAQSPPDFQSIAARMESNDILIRLTARADLAKAGKSALPFIQQVLVDPKAAYRLRLGVIAALNGIGGLKEDSLNTIANCVIVRAAADVDLALKTEAYQYVRTHPELPSSKACGLDKDPSCPSPVAVRLTPRTFAQISVQGTPLYFYLAGLSSPISKDDRAEIYIINSEDQSWRSARQMNRATFATNLKSLTAANDAALPAETFKRSIMTNADKLDFTLASGAAVRITVETHYIRDFVQLTICN